MSRFFPLLLIAVLVGMVPALAQKKGDEIPPPSAPFFTAPPWGSAWSMNVTYNVPDKSAKGEAAVPRPLTDPEKNVLPDSMQIRLGGNKVVEGIITYGNGRKETYYISQGMLFQKYMNNNLVSVSPAAEGDAAFDSTDIGTTPALFRISKFPGTGWLSLATYQGIELIDKEPCYKYAMTTSAVDGFADIHRQTWIRVSDGYPVQARINNTLLRFSPVALLAENILLPPEYQAMAQKVDNQRKAMEAMRKANAR